MRLLQKGADSVMNIGDRSGREQTRDPALYLELSNEYGWKLYSYLRAKLKDPKDLPAAYEKAMQRFYQSVIGQSGQGNLEARLYEAADSVCETGKPAAQKLKGHTVSDTAENMLTETKGGFGFWLALVLLLLLNTVCLWFIVGLLMDMGFIPVFDLGYSWFHANVAPWFW